jgi:hypothetical protein
VEKQQTLGNNTQHTATVTCCQWGFGWRYFVWAKKRRGGTKEGKKRKRVSFA